MLVELRIRDFAVIRDLSVEMGPGLNALTGETGAGKSILIGALSLLLGERASSDSVRTGSDRATVEAVFDLSDHPELAGRLGELGLPEADGFLVLRREVQAEGRNRAWINGSPVTAGTVGEFGRALVDLHGQHEHQTLLHPDEQRAILDAFAGAGPLAAEVSALHGELRGVRSEREARAARVREIESRADFVRFQLGEIREAELHPGEDGELEAELRRLDHAEELARDADLVHRLLYGEEGAASERLARARDLLQRLASVDEALAPVRDEVEALYHGVTEAGRSLGDYASGVEMDPARAEELRRRADLLFRLKRKYGPELQDVVETGRRLEGELSELEDSEVAVEELDRRIEELRGRLEERAARLGEARREAAARLAGEVEALLPELGMPGALFRVALELVDEVGPGGTERVQFRASLNPGFEPRPLSRIASGGELSRVMLALKAILTRVDRVPTLIFDEIDAGIGGEVATAVAEKLRNVAERHQVLVITHLPQLASRGNRHLRVEKGTTDGVAATVVVQLDGEERVREIARMLGGDPDSSTSREHARELLAAG
jgi:DNA repair protein RecN (Recombination protein N)